MLCLWLTRELGGDVKGSKVHKGGFIGQGSMGCQREGGESLASHGVPMRSRHGQPARREDRVRERLRRSEERDIAVIADAGVRVRCAARTAQTRRTGVVRTCGDATGVATLSS